MSDTTEAAGTGRVVAIIYGEGEEYTIWFLSGYGYHAEFINGSTENGTYSVDGNMLTLTSVDGVQRQLDTEWRMDFGNDKPADYIKADFSDSSKIIGEFNLNDQAILEIQDKDEHAIGMEEIEKTIDNRYALEILNSILPCTGEEAQI